MNFPITKSKKALQLLGFESKKTLTKKPTIEDNILNSVIKNTIFDSLSDSSLKSDNSNFDSSLKSDNSDNSLKTNDIVTSKLYNVIQSLKDDSNLSSIETSDIEEDDHITKKNIFIPKEFKPKSENQHKVYIPNNRFIDHLESLRLQREKQETKKMEQQRLEQETKKLKSQEKIHNKYLKQLLSMDSDLDADNESEFIEYKLKKGLSLDD